MTCMTTGGKEHLTGTVCGKGALIFDFFADTQLGSLTRFSEIFVFCPKILVKQFLKIVK